MTERYDFREIVERLPLVVYVDRLDELSSPVYVSPQIVELLGYSQEEWLADPGLFARCLHPDDRERVLAEVVERNRGVRGAEHSDYRMVTRDGRTVWIRDEEVVLHAGCGAGTAHGYMQDVTARHYDTQRLALLAEVLALAAEDLTPQEIVSRTADRLAEALGDVVVTYVELHPGPRVVPRYTTNPAGLLDGVPLIEEAFAPLAHGPVVIEDVREAPWLEPAWPTLEAKGVRGAVDVPLHRNGELAGVLWFNTPEPRKWDPEEVRMLADVGAQLAVVLERAEAEQQQRRAEHDLRRREAILEAVSRAAEGFLTHPDLDSAMAELMRELGEATAAGGAYVFENVAAGRAEPLSLRRAAWTPGPLPVVDDPRLAHLAPAPHFPRWAAVLGTGGTICSHVADLPADEREALALIGAKSVAAVPVMVDGDWWGFIGFEDYTKERDWSAAELDALRAAAGLVAAAAVRDRTQRDLRRRDAVVEAVSHVAARLLAEPFWRDAAPGLLERLGVAADASRAYLFECGSRDGVPTISQTFEWSADGVEPQLDNELMQDLNVEEVGLGRIAEFGRANQPFAAVVSELPPGERELFEAQQILSLAVVPIQVDGEWWGFIGLDECTVPRRWTAAELDALRTAASLVSAAIGRERAEAVLREHEQKLRAVFDTALDAVFINDDERRYVDVNPAGCDYLGVARRDLIGRRIDDFLPADRLATVEADWQAYLAGGPILAEWEMVRADGQIRIAEASAQPNFLPGLHIAFFRDVTDRKRLESDLLNSQKLESLGRLAGGVAHDFNNLLTGITGYAALALERAQGDEDLSHDLSEIVRAADRAAELTKQLLAFGRRQVLQPRPLDLNAALAEVGSLLRRLLGEHVTLEVRQEEALGTVRADPGQIEQVIVNLAVNARDAMPSGGRLTIETRNAPDRFVELSFTDTGSGMDETTKARIFEPFFTTREQGVGLGLASVYGIVQQSGGDIAVRSAPGEGSTFTVRLPRVADDVQPEETATAPAVAPGSGTILLVEDEDVVRDLTRRVLERQGYTVLACADGEEALAVAAGHESAIDLLLTDVVMPGLRGHEVAELVAETRPGIKVLYMSGYSEEALLGRAAISGSALIEKPFAVDVLARRVREALEAA